MRSNGVGAAGGVGEVIADYITEGNTKFDMYNLDIQRFIAIHNNRKFLHDRVKEVPGLIYAIPYPFKEYNASSRHAPSTVDMGTACWSRVINDILMA